MREFDDIIFKICGSAGDGSISATEILNRAAALQGYHVMNFDSFPAEIRGFGKSVGHSRICGRRAFTPGIKADVLVALNDKHAITELPALESNAVIIYDSKPSDFHGENEAVAGFIQPGMSGYGIPLRELSTMAVKSTRSRNIVALGAISAIFKLPLHAFKTALKKRFANKPPDVAEKNIRALEIGFDHCQKNIEKIDPFDFQLRSYDRTDTFEIISGNEAVAQGCLEADIKLYAGYPITPATKIMEILAEKMPSIEGVVVQTEDEISAVGHVLGGGFAGKRCATATSGPGICLMTETINLGVMAEIPMVIVNSQRGGPSTGLPTKTEQSDLGLAVFGGSGDSPRPVIAPTNVEECYSLTVKAFEISECFQTPVILLLDFFLSNRFEDLDLDSVDLSFWGDYSERIANSDMVDYKRFEFTEDGISPRAKPGMDHLFHAVTGLEHDEWGFPNYESNNHRKMTEKRHSKMNALTSQWPKAERFNENNEFEWGVISWGSSVGAAREVIMELNEMGIKAGGFFPRLIWPLNSRDLMEFSSRCQRLAVIEMNHTGQYAHLIESTVNGKIHRVCEVCAKPFSVDYIIHKIKGEGA